MYFLIGGAVPAMCTWLREQFDSGAAASLLSRVPKKGSEAPTSGPAVVSCFEAPRDRTQQNPGSIIPSELCEDVVYCLLGVGNLVLEDLEESREKPVRRTQIYEFPDLFCQANGPQRRQAANS